MIGLIAQEAATKSNNNRMSGKKNIGGYIDNLGLLTELSRSLYLIGHYSKQIIEAQRTVFGLPMSAELRRLYSLGKGNHLLKRIEQRFNVSLKYPVKYRSPNNYKLVSLDTYINSLAFVSEGTRYTKLEVINLVANQRGAHTANEIDSLHYVSPFINLPWGNPAKTKLFLPQDLHCLLSISQDTYMVADKQLRVLMLTNQKQSGDIK